MLRRRLRPRPLARHLKRRSENRRSLRLVLMLDPLVLLALVVPVPLSIPAGILARKQHR